jgi:hypothetical protein
MFRLKNYLIHNCLHVGQKVTFAGCIRAQVKEVYTQGHIVRSGKFKYNTLLLECDDTSMILKCHST